MKHLHHQDAKLLEHLFGEQNIHYLQKDDMRPAFGFYFINDRTGRARWIFPITTQKTTFLNTYNGSGLKAFSICLIIKLLFLFRLQRLLCAGQFWIMADAARPFFQLIKQHQAEDFSIFMGTIGANRKLIVEINKEGKTTHFIKVPTTGAGQRLVLNEYSTLQQLQQNEMLRPLIPTAQFNLRFMSITVSNIQSGRFNYSGTLLQNTHLDFLKKLQQETFEIKQLGELSMYWEILDRLLYLEENAIPKNGIAKAQSLKIIHQLRRLYERLDPRQYIEVCRMHGDFTPWNMYMKKNELKVYDWELSKTAMPVGMDLLHFVFQSNVLIQKHNFQHIKKQLTSIKKKYDQYFPPTRSFELYLLHTISYYLQKYLQQTDLHEQAFWLLDVWEDALSYALCAHHKKRTPSPYFQLPETVLTAI